MKRQVMVCVALAALTGCSGGSSAPSVTDGTRAPSTASSDEEASPDETEDPGVAVDPKARKAVRSAFLRLVRANTGRLEVDVSIAGAEIREWGSYQVEPVAFDVVREQQTSEATVRVAYRGVGDELWLRLETITSEKGDQGQWTCWVSFDDIERLPDFPVQLARPAEGQPPAAVIAASYGVGKYFSGESIEGTTDLALAVGLVSGKFLVNAGIDPQEDHPVPATFRVDAGGTLSGFSVPVAELPDAIATAGGSLDEQLGVLANHPGAISVRFTHLGAPVEIHTPPADERLRVTGTEDYEDMVSCGRS